MPGQKGGKSSRPSGSNTGTNRPTGPKAASKDAIAVEGKVLEALPNAMFQLELDTGHKVLGHIGGKMRQNFIKILPGDRVVVELSPYDLKRGRITYRYK